MRPNRAWPNRAWPWHKIYWGHEFVLKYHINLKKLLGTHQANGKYIQPRMCTVQMAKLGNIWQNQGICWKYGQKLKLDAFHVTGTVSSLENFNLRLKIAILTGATPKKKFHRPNFEIWYPKTHTSSMSH